MTKITMKIDGMMCGMCEAHVNEAIRGAFRVKKVTSSHTKGECIVISENDIPDEELQNAVLVDEIGFTFRETDVSDDGEPEYTRNEGYFVNIRLLDDGFDDSVFREWVVTPERPLREWF